MARIGIMGGTFNPPHVGHLLCASEASDQLGLDHVLFVPAHTPPHKEVAAGAPAPHVRAELCRLATQDDPRFHVSNAEIERGGASFSVDTLRTMRAERPGDELVLIIGADMALSLPTWHQPAEVCSLATIGVAGRQGVLRTDIVDRLDDLPVTLEFFDMPRFDISSSEIRRRLGAGQRIDYLVPAAVAEHLRRAGHYQAKVPA